MLRYMPPAIQRWLTILLPPIALLTCCMVMVPRHNRMQKAQRDIKSTQASINDYLGKLRAISDLPKDPRVASLPATKQEQTDFLRGLSVLCARTGNRLLNVNALSAPPPAPPPPAGAPAPVAPPAGSLPPDVLEIKSTVIFEGSFQSLRALLASLQQSNRLVSLSDCRVGAGPGGFPNLQTTLSISRYVDIPLPPTPAGGPTAPQPGAPAPIAPGGAPVKAG
jgi:hypothetical protein